MEEAIAEHKRAFKGVWIPAEVWLNPDLSLTEKALYSEIDSLDGEEGCFASNEYFAGFFGASERSIQRGLSHLRELGYVSQETFNGRTRRLRATRQKCHGRGDKNVTSGVTKMSPIYNNIENSLDKSPHTPQGEFELTLDGGCKKEESVLSAKGESGKPTPPNAPATPSPKSDEDFDAFWAAYPKCERKSGKAECRAIWHSRNLSSVKGRLMKALEIDKASRGWTKNNGDYIPFPKTWLNKKRYLDIEDEPVVVSSVAQWSVLPIDAGISKSVEWASWRDVWTFDPSVPPPSWSVKSEEWVKANRHLIESAQKVSL